MQKTIRALKKALPKGTVEALVPDFRGSLSALKTVIAARPDVIGHNVETVPSLYRAVCPMSIYVRSLQLLERIKTYSSSIYSKSGLIAGLGETKDEVLRVMDDLVMAGCDILTIGQYLSPSRRHIPVAEYVPPSRFDEYKQIGLKKGFKYVASGPLVRSSYHAMDALHAVKAFNHK